jgi:hypothetical protein
MWRPNIIVYGFRPRDLVVQQKLASIPGGVRETFHDDKIFDLLLRRPVDVRLEHFKQMYDAMQMSKDVLDSKFYPIWIARILSKNTNITPADFINPESLSKIRVLGDHYGKDDGMSRGLVKISNDKSNLSIDDMLRKKYATNRLISTVGLSVILTSAFVVPAIVGLVPLLLRC